MSYFRNLADLPSTCPSQCFPWPLIWWMHCSSNNWKRFKSWGLACPMVNSLLVTVIAEITGSHAHGLGQLLCPVSGQTGIGVGGGTAPAIRTGTASIICCQHARKHWQATLSHQMCFIAAFGTPAVYCQLFATFKRFGCPPAWKQIWSPHFRALKQPWSQCSQPSRFAKPGFCPLAQSVCFQLVSPYRKVTGALSTTLRYSKITVLS